ncbi:uncharacterized protein BO80DRAFT_460880 [Aspergillus ibericus CBS 121593]|uniref:Ribonuclease H-like protein n=1 Tax=Aspergillus ibericus CBS 121593 TaxID=1448316 RepID=A0A395HCX9_9EURO|nr:ribonuclease H-like protein [Aspergillus ibericus CBS 121593]RAL05821.1 ribonuclease H-like protein [Aspergillus ibericus CBS 121593]
MHLTRPTLKALTTKSLPKALPTQNGLKYPWLHTLKSTTLQHLAHQTGIKSSGTKPVLIRRLEGELARCVYTLPLGHYHGSGSGSGGGSELRGRGSGEGKELRVLSIDMGIRNLAFACLRVTIPPHYSPASASGGLAGTKDHEPGKGNGKGSGIESITLQAWRRLSIPHLREEFNLTPQRTSKSKIQFITPDEDPPSESTSAAKEDFSPPIYAHHAYTLITTLLDRYQPTHILIERQRFRSGGGSAVQEWTIRVGMFEGMLYAVLEAIGRFSSTSTSSSRDFGGEGQGGVEVWGMEPGRVSRFWAERGVQDQDQDQGQSDGDGDEGGKGKKGKKKKSVRDVKKMKIGLVGEWLRQTGEESGARILVEDEEVKQWVDAFLEKYQGKRRRKDAVEFDIGKLDDLADCLVQGITWLEWQRMRQQVVLSEGRSIDRYSL